MNGPRPTYNYIYNLHILFPYKMAVGFIVAWMSFSWKWMIKLRAGLITHYFTVHKSQKQTKESHLKRKKSLYGKQKWWQINVKTETIVLVGDYPCFCHDGSNNNLIYNIRKNLFSSNDEYFFLVLSGDLFVLFYLFNQNRHRLQQRITCCFYFATKHCYSTNVTK